MARKTKSLRALVLDFSDAALVYARAVERNAASAARNGLANIRLMAAEDKALARLEAARAELLDRLPE